MRRRLLLAVVLGVCLAVAFGSAVMTAQPPGAQNPKARPGAVPGAAPPGAVEDRQPGAPPPPPGVPPGPDVRGPGMPGPVPSAAAALAVPPPQMGRPIAQRLGLSEDVAKRLQEILDKAPEKVEPLRRTCADSVEALRRALYAPEKDGPSLRQLMDKANAAEAEVAKAELALWMEIRALLSADQLKELGDMMMRPGRRIGPPEAAPGTPPTPPGAPGPRSW